MKWLWLVAAAGCFAPSYSDRTRCGAEGACPAGRSCVDGVCLAAAASADAPLADAPLPDAGGFTVVTKAPADGAGGLPATTVVNVTFSSAVVPSTVSAGTFTLATSDGTSVTGTVSVAPDRLSATFTPAAPLVLKRIYKVFLTAGIRGAAGGMLAPVTWSFAVDYAWQTPEQIWADLYGPIFALSVAMNGAGDAAVGWTASNGVTTLVYAMIGPHDGRWGQLLDGHGAPAETVATAIADDGEVDVIWQESVGGSAGTAPFLAHNVVKGATEFPWLFQQLEPDQTTSLAQTPRIVFDGSATATAVWVQSRPYLAVPFATRHATSATSWPAPSSIVGLGAAAGALDAAVDPSTGDVVVVFSVGPQAMGTFATVHDAGSGWTDVASSIDAAGTDGYSSGPPRVAAAGGVATAVWVRGPSSALKATANRRSAGTWGEAKVIDAVDTGTSSGPSVGVDAAGNAVAVWLHSALNAPRQVWANRSATAGWGTAARVSTGGEEATAPSVTVDRNGDAVAVWLAGDAVWAARGLVDGGWAIPVRLSPASSAATMPAAAVDAMGRVVVVWVGDGTALWAAWMR